MDITWLTDRIAVGGGIWTSENMEKVAEEGITHVIDMQIEFDDTPLGLEHGVEVLWNPTDDDFTPKPPGWFKGGSVFGLEGLGGRERKLFFIWQAGGNGARLWRWLWWGRLG